MIPAADSTTRTTLLNESRRFRYEAGKVRRDAETRARELEAHADAADRTLRTITSRGSA